MGLASSAPVTPPAHSRAQDDSADRAAASPAPSAPADNASAAAGGDPSQRGQGARSAGADAAPPTRETETSAWAHGSAVMAPGARAKLEAQGEWPPEPQGKEYTNYQAGARVREGEQGGDRDPGPESGGVSPTQSEYQAFWDRWTSKTPEWSAESSPIYSRRGPWEWPPRPGPVRNVRPWRS